MKVSTFILDTKGPAISVNAPIKDKIYLTGDQIDTINDAILKNTIDKLTGGSGSIKGTFYTLLRNNVKDIFQAVLTILIRMLINNTRTG